MLKSSWILSWPLIAAAHEVATYQGQATGDRSGAALCAAGDLDGDGRADWIVGAPGFGVGTGRAAAVSGASGAELWYRLGDSIGDRLGTSLARLGDVDGDGLADFVVGAPLGEPGAGEVLTLSGADGRVLWRRTGSAAGDRFGQSVCALGDVNQDGVPDLAVGAPQNDEVASAAGRVSVLSGVDGNELFGVTGSSLVELFGTSVAGAQDANGDGVPDLAVGAPFEDSGAFNAGAVQVFSGVDGSLLFAVHGEAAGDQFGDRVALVGDVDGDGARDLAASAPGSEAGGLDSGAVTVFRADSGVMIARIEGTAAGERLQTVADAGDVDGDGLDDLWVGAADGGTAGSGLVRLVNADSGEELARLEGDPNDWLGAALALVGDVNGDGQPEVAAGAPIFEDSFDSPGSVRVLSPVPLALEVHPDALDGQAGGTAEFSLDAGSEHGGELYLLLGCVQLDPLGLSVDGWSMPLGLDSWLLFALGSVGSAPYADALGVLAPDGRASAAFEWSQSQWPLGLELVVHHAFCVLGPTGSVQFTSPSTALRLAGLPSSPEGTPFRVCARGAVS